MSDKQRNTTDSFDNRFIDKIKELNESHNLDFKQSPNKKIVEKLVAMANQQGGEIYVGISDQKPREIFHVDFEELEEKISQGLNQANPKTEVRYDTLKYRKLPKDENKSPEICDVIRIWVGKSEKLIQFKGEFPIIDIGSSHKRKLRYDEIVAFDRKYQEFRNEFLEKLSSEKSKKSHIFINFAMTPSFSTQGYFDFLSSREIMKPIITQITNETEDSYMGFRSRGGVSWFNDKFNHPLKDIIREFQLFGTPDTYATAVSHNVVDHRTGNRLLIHKNGLIVGKIRFQLDSGSRKLNFKNIFENPSLYEYVSEGKDFPRFKTGSFLRVLSFVCYLYAAEADWNWRLNKSTVFALQIGLCNMSGTSIKSDDPFRHHKNEFLKEDGIIHVEKVLDLNLTSIKLEVKTTSQNYNDVLKTKITKRLSTIENELIPQIHSYFGSKSSIYFAGRRKDIEKPLISIDETRIKLIDAFWKRFDQFPLFNLFNSPNRTEIPIEPLYQEPLYEENGFQVTLAKIDFDNANPGTKDKLLQIIDPKQEHLILGIREIVKCPDGYFLDEFVSDSVMGISLSLFTNYIKYLLETQFDLLKEKEIHISEKTVFKTFQDVAIEKRPNLEPKIVVDDKVTTFEFKTSISLNSFIKFQKDIGLTNMARIGMILNENFKLEFPYWNEFKIDEKQFKILKNLSHRIRPLIGFESIYQYLLKAGEVGTNSHLFYNLILSVDADFKYLSIDFYYFIDYPSNSVVKFQLPDGEKSANKKDSN